MEDTARPIVGRMRKRPEFLAARKGRRLNGPFFFVEVRDRHDGDPPRLGITVTRKVGNAVARNRIRRRLREAVRTVCGADMTAGFDYVVVARRDVLDLPFDRLVFELTRRLRGRPANRSPADEMAGPARAAAQDDRKRPLRGSAGNG